MPDTSREITAQAAPKPIRLADYRPPAFLVDTVDLTFDLDEMETTVVSRLALRRNPTGEPEAPLRLDGDAIAPARILLDGEALGPNRYRIEDGQLVIPESPDSFTLEIETRINPAANTLLSGLYVSNGSFFTQCEAEGFRRITYFSDRPDVMARYTTTIRADKTDCPVLLSNGNPVAHGEMEGGRHWAKWEDPHPKPCYLFALVAGDLISVTNGFKTRSGREIALAIWVRRGDEDKCAHAMRSLIKAMAWDEQRFGLEYDLDVFNVAAVSDFNMGAMENKGLNIFNTKYVLAKPETATDDDYEGIETVIAHEYFHNWTGNRVTCRDWFQLSLKEGLTVFRDQEFSMDQGSAAVKRINDVRRLRAAQFPEDAGPLAHPVQPDSYIAIDNFYTATVYNKGAEVIRMMQTLIGREAFRRGMDLYFARHDNQAVTIEDLVTAMQDASGTDLTAFRSWYHQAGTPELTIEDDYEADTHRYTLTARQSTPPTPGQPEKQPAVIPLATGLLGSDGQELPILLEGEERATEGTRVLVLNEAEQRFRFLDVPERPVPSVLRGFSAPVKLKNTDLDRARFLASHDTDPFVRWDSGQQYATALLLDAAGRWRRGEPVTVERGLIEALQATLAQSDKDPAFIAEAMTLPTESFLAEQMEVADPEAIHAVREQARVEIARQLADALRARYKALHDAGPYQLDGRAIGRRALRNLCLAYLAAEGSTDGVALAKAQFDADQNMTDVLAALVALSAIDCPERQEALAGFYEKWRHEDLVLDKWFAIQAASPLPGTLRSVKELQHHPDFDLKNPNRLRSLIGSFASANPVRFHDATGAGYQLLADTIIELDPINGQVAARFVPPLGRWRRYDEGRQALMKQELQRILDVPGLTKGTYEMASKSLA
ncbi:MAG: aminopeptidase N [Acetobacteraceae bacterium]|nr:aminopeptidase N [Acetobacteraceae bacterium]